MPLPERRPVTCARLGLAGGRPPAQPLAPKPARDPEKEKSRKYRRTTFGHDEWAAHRSTSRYWRHLKSGLLASRIVRGLTAPLTYVGIISAAVSSYEWALAQGMLHDIGPWQWPSLSMSMAGPFSLSTFALSLLLVFRTNSSYQRWNEARRLWGLCTNRSRDIARQALQWMPPDRDTQLAAAMCRWATAFPLVLMCSLREDHSLKETLQDVLLPEELAFVLQQQHPGTAVLQAMGACVQASHAQPIQKLRIDENITVMQDVMGGCERIFRTPIPLSYTRHTSRFLVCWLTLLPFCVADAFGWLTIPISIGLAFFLFGIEEIGVQIEEPFGILALEVFCNNITNSIRQAQAAAAPLRAAAQAHLGTTQLPLALLLSPSTLSNAGGGSGAGGDSLAREFNHAMMVAAGAARSSSDTDGHHSSSPAAGAASIISSCGGNGGKGGCSGRSSPAGMHHHLQHHQQQQHMLRSELARSSILLAAAGLTQQAAAAPGASEPAGIGEEQLDNGELYVGSSLLNPPSDDEGYHF